MPGASDVRDLTAEEVAAGLSAGKMMLVDVREPNETQIERIPGSVLSPSSLIRTRCPIRTVGLSCFPAAWAFARCVPPRPHWLQVYPMMPIWRVA
jgi:rhodanese-related sulfurtransferase